MTAADVARFPVVTLQLEGGVNVSVAPEEYLVVPATAGAAPAVLRVGRRRDASQLRRWQRSPAGFELQRPGPTAAARVQELVPGASPTSAAARVAGAPMRCMGVNNTGPPPYDYFIIGDTAMKVRRPWRRWCARTCFLRTC